MDKVNIYTLTGFTNPKKRKGSCSYVLELVREGREPVTLNDTYHENDATDKQAELGCIIRAMKRLNKPCELTIFMDSPYVAACFAQGYVENWKHNGWTRKQGKPLSNREEWEELYSLLSKHLYEFITGAHHSYREWMINEVMKDEKKNEKAAV